MDGVGLERRGAVAVITLDRPPVNALSRALIASLAKALDTVEADDSVSVVHIRNTGRSFCGGADLDEMRAGFASPEGAGAQVAFVRRLQEVFQRLEDVPVVTLAEIGGHALGGGLELALACDLRIGAAEVRMGLPEVNLGLVPGAGGTQRLARLCGPAVARRLILGAEVVDGVTAADLGILHWVVPAAELAATAGAIADRLAALPRAAVAGAKRCIAAAGMDGNDGFDAELSVTRALMDEPETRRRVGAFLSRGR